MRIQVRRRLRWVVAGLAVSVFAGAGFAHSSASPIQQALDRGYRAGTNRFDLTIAVGTGGKQYALKVKGSFDLRNNHGAFTVDFGRLFASIGLTVEGAPAPSKLDMLLDDNVLYVHLPPIAKAYPGKEWLKVDPKTLPHDQTAGSDLSGISSLSPRTALAVVGGASAVRTLGSETLSGERMTRYRVVVNASKLADAVTPAQRAQIRAFMKQLGVTSSTLDVWIDGPGYIRRISSLPATLDETSSNQSTTLKSTMSFRGFGTPVTVSVPPAAKTVDVAKALSEAGDGKPSTGTTTTPTQTTGKPSTGKPSGSLRPAVTFAQDGTSLGQPLAAPGGANGLNANMNPGSGAVMNAYWLKDGKWLGQISVPAGANGLVFSTSPAAGPGAAQPRPKAATGFHVFWDQAGVITGAKWTSVGKPLATIPVSSGQQAIAFTNGTG